MLGALARRCYPFQLKMNYMPGTASLIEDIDKKHLVLLRDGRTLIGFLRSIDQFGMYYFWATPVLCLRAAHYFFSVISR